MVFIVTDGRWLGSTPSPFRYGSTFYVGLLIRISIQTFHRRRTLDPVRPASFFLLLLHYEFAKWSGAFVCWLDGLSRPVAIEKRTLLASLHTPLGMKNGTFGKYSTYLNLVWRTNVFTVQGNARSGGGGELRKRISPRASPNSLHPYQPTVGVERRGQEIRPSICPLYVTVHLPKDR